MQIRKNVISVIQTILNIFYLHFINEICIKIESHLQKGHNRIQIIHQFCRESGLYFPLNEFHLSYQLKQGYRCKPKKWSHLVQFFQVLPFFHLYKWRKLGILIYVFKSTYLTRTLKKNLFS